MYTILMLNGIAVFIKDPDYGRSRDTCQLSDFPECHVRTFEKMHEASRMHFDIITSGYHRFPVPVCMYCFFYLAINEKR